MLTALQRTWPYLVYGSLLFGMVGMLWRRLRAVRGERDRERRGREEMEAYTRLDLRSTGNSDARGMARRVCGVIAARSAFRRVAMMSRDGQGRMSLIASEGMDGATVLMVERWLDRVREQERESGGRWGEGVGIGLSSMVISLGSDGRREPSRAIVVPVKTAAEHMVGALLVCADSVMQVRRRSADETVVGLEALATKLGRAMEQAETDVRPRRVERLAGKLLSSRSYPLKVVRRSAAHLQKDVSAFAGQREDGMVTVAGNA